ncbi:FUSC family protein, partial [Pseudomonas aeruginosa]|nr:FUSC family protein [Pseudomonas aeruginosa]
PVLYLACEVAATHRAALSLVPYLVVATLPSVALAGVDTLRHASAHLKLRDRGLGALLGVPLGLAVGAALPHVLLVHTLATLAS